MPKWDIFHQLCSKTPNGSLEKRKNSFKNPFSVKIFKKSRNMVCKCTFSFKTKERMLNHEMNQNDLNKGKLDKMRPFWVKWQKILKSVSKIQPFFGPAVPSVPAKNHKNRLWVAMTCPGGRAMGRGVRALEKEVPTPWCVRGVMVMGGGVTGTPYGENTCISQISFTNNTKIPVLMRSTAFQLGGIWKVLRES